MTTTQYKHTFNDRLEAIRFQKGYSIPTMIELMRVAGTKAREAGCHFFDQTKKYAPETIQILAEVIDCPVSDLMMLASKPVELISLIEPTTPPTMHEQDPQPLTYGNLPTPCFVRHKQRHTLFFCIRGTRNRPFSDELAEVVHVYGENDSLGWTENHLDRFCGHYLEVIPTPTTGIKGWTHEAWSLLEAAADKS